MGQRNPNSGWTLYDAGTGTLRTKPDPDPDYSGYTNPGVPCKFVSDPGLLIAGIEVTIRHARERTKAERAERRARGAVLYLVLITTVLIVMSAAMAAFVSGIVVAAAALIA